MTARSLRPPLTFPQAAVSDAWHLCIFTAGHYRFQQGVSPGNGGRNGVDQGPEQSNFPMKMCMPQLRIQKEKMGNNLAEFLTHPAEERRAVMANL